MIRIRLQTQNAPVIMGNKQHIPETEKKLCYTVIRYFMPLAFQFRLKNETISLILARSLDTEGSLSAR